MSPFSAPFSWAPRSEWLLLPKRAAALSEGTQWGKGGTGKAEAAKLQDAGISPKQWPKKMSGRKKHLDVVHVSHSPDDESLDSSGAGPSISCTGRVNERHRLGYAEQQ